MTIFEVILLALTLFGFGGIFYFLKISRPEKGTQDEEETAKKLFEENFQIKSKLELSREEIGRLSSELESARSERDKLEGKGRQAYAELTEYKEENKNLRHERDEIKAKITKFESEKERREKDHEKLIEQLENSRKKLESEQARVIREDEERLQKEREEYDRVWNDHENSAISQLKEICQRPQFSFNFFDNTNLPADFDGSFKPDFLVDFLGQYIIFDAKIAKDIPNLSKRLNEEVKKTVEKIKKSENSSQIYSIVFFIVPTVLMQGLKKTYFYEEGFHFYIVTPEALESIIAAYKRITEYEKISELDPQERENIVNLIAHYDRHISFQNATNVLLASEGLKTMRSKEILNSEFLSEIEIKKQTMRSPRFDTDIKKLTQSLDLQEREIQKMVNPKVEIGEKEMKEVQESLL
ncbi:hypothetical protein HZA38_04530 [Candidatus Peregrinibacteria bacterium]|nr:hypothetical protein [Candidatus Peregrinibacteria bacterium]